MVSSEEPLKLTYRELADRLGISLSAARARVRRARQQGRWRVVPRNHPNSPAQIELPALDLEAAEREMAAAKTGAVNGDGANADPFAKMDEDVYAATLSALQEAYRYVDENTSRLHDALAENSALKEKLASAEAARQYLQQRLDELERLNREQQDRLTGTMLEKLENVVEISRLTATLEERNLYVARLELGARNLQILLQRAQRPAWKKLLGLRR